jgi:hypothetical protein
MTAPLPGVKMLTHATTCDETGRISFHFEALVLCRTHLPRVDITQWGIVDLDYQHSYDYRK